MYEYREPTENGYKRVHLSRKHHNMLFKYRQIGLRKLIFARYEYYLSDKTFLMYCFTSKVGIAVATLMFPLNVVIHGIGNIGELITEYRRLYNQKKYGAFTSDSAYSGSNRFEEIKKYATY